MNVGPVFRPPVIKEREASHPALRFVCAGKSNAMTWYTGRTARAAYDYWVRKTKAGQRHNEYVGFRESFVTKEAPDFPQVPEKEAVTGHVDGVADGARTNLRGTPTGTLRHPLPGKDTPGPP